jgi:N-acyl-D-aspartate/D-glutamate deacylase
MYDFIIRGGLVYDGTGASPKVADVAVRDGKVAAIGNLAAESGAGGGVAAARVVDATGKIVIPGFIDPHVHEEMTLFSDNAYELFLRQGVTTTVNGNCGHSVTPGGTDYIVDYFFNNGLISENNKVQFKRDFPKWENFSGYVEAARRTGTNVNLVVLLGHGTIRQFVMNGAHDRPPTAKEKERIDAFLRAGLSQGAWGVSFGLDYVPSRYAKTEELVDVARIAKEFDGVVSAHLRHWIGTKEAVLEMVEVCRRTGVTTQISHLKSNAEDAFLAAESAAAEGLPLRIDTIPKSSGHCNRKDKLLQSIMAISDELFDKGVEGVRQALHTKEGRKVIVRDAHAKFGMDKEKVFIVISEDPSLEGKSIAQIARERGDSDPTQTMLDLAGDDKEYTFWLGGPTRDDFGRDHSKAIMANPYVSVGTDRIMGDPHDPFFWYELLRYGGFPTFMKMYRKAGVAVEEIVRRNTSLVADHFGIKNRGRLQPGQWADIAVIDLQKYDFPEPQDVDCRKPLTMASGVEYVMVNGVLAIDGGELKKSLSGSLLLRNENR